MLGHAACKVFLLQVILFFGVSRISVRSLGCHEDVDDLATLSFADVTGFNTLVFVGDF